jgi:hypothetical protein
MPASNGGIPGPLGVVLFPIYVSATGMAFMYTLDPTNFNDLNSASAYTWKQEDVICGRQPTINRIYVSHRDLGIAKINVFIAGNNDAGALEVNSTPMTLGTVAASGRIITTVWDQVNLTAQNLQLAISRDAGSGPVSITKVRLEGAVEK